MSEPEVRIARTEALFRDVNERIAGAERFKAREAEFVCDCGDPSCVERLSTTLDRYEEVRSDGTTFMLVPGHEDPAAERVVKQPHRRLAIIEKFSDVVVKIVRRLNLVRSQLSSQVPGSHSNSMKRASLNSS
jgi:hypothetical protein